jgi:hypothetical protein
MCDDVVVNQTVLDCYRRNDELREAGWGLRLYPQPYKVSRHPGANNKLAVVYVEQDRRKLQKA